MQTAGSWFGGCSLWSDGVTGGGVCDGNGPNWTYQAFATCVWANGAGYVTGTTGVRRWAGDRRGPYAYCSSFPGGVIFDNYWGINVYLNGQWQFTYYGDPAIYG